MKLQNIEFRSNIIIGNWKLNIININKLYIIIIDNT